MFQTVTMTAELMSRPKERYEVDSTEHELLYCYVLTCLCFMQDATPVAPAKLPVKPRERGRPRDPSAPPATGPTPLKSPLKSPRSASQSVPRTPDGAQKSKTRQTGPGNILS